ncbi:MAG: hypothetical protein J6A08_08550 [Lachnospiraceae bacterium]|nr:hypothetical protein [Lachnospiraceae bacterium]
MLSVILIWCYMLVTASAVGYGVLHVLTSRIPYRIRHMDSYLMCGLVCVTVYAQFFSLFYKVGLLANLILCAVCIMVLWRSRQALGCMFAGVWSQIKENQSGKRGRMLVILFLFLLFAYGTSRGIIHYDTGLYHAQSIRWLEEYGVVKGLGNLHCRLAYNSSSFALSALYSMAFLGGQSYHCCAGLFAFIVAKLCLEMWDSLRRCRLRVSDFARVMGIYYLVNIFDEMVSPASDYFMVLTAFYIVIRWLDLVDSEEKEALPYALLCVAGVFLMTVKLSAALILLLVIHPAYYLLKNRKWREIVLYLCLGIVTALPYFIRNIIISGWAVYPFTMLKLLDVPWKIPEGLADYDAREIQVYGRGYTDVAQFDRPVREWLPEWFRGLAGSDKVLVLAAGASVCILLLWGIRLLWKTLGYKRKQSGGIDARMWQILLVQATMAGSFLFWLATSPLIRYGCVYVYLTSAVISGSVYDRMMEYGAAKTGAGTGRRRKLYGAAGRLCMAAVLLLTGYKVFALGREIATTYTNDYWLVQKDYENYEVIPYEINGVVFYYPAQGDQVGYESFPSSPTIAEIGFLGEDIEDGFYRP